MFYIFNSNSYKYSPGSDPHKARADVTVQGELPERQNNFKIILYNQSVKDIYPALPPLIPHSGESETRDQTIDIMISDAYIDEAARSIYPGQKG